MIFPLTNSKRLLTPEEYENARASTLNAHYTPQVVIDSVYSALKNMNLPRNANILEPSCGTGNFIRRLPSNFDEAKITGVELDPFTAKIAKYLCANATIKNCGFEETKFENNSFDAVIGNVPFGDYNLRDPEYSKDLLIHDAFFRKSLDKAAPGGVVALVTSSGTLDKQSPKVREMLAEKAELIGAIRLPNNAFSDAGTKVTADIIFLQKRQTPLLPYEKKPDWCYTVKNSEGIKINAYFDQNPQMVLGKMRQTSHFNMTTCDPQPDKELSEQLKKAVTKLNSHISIKNQEKRIDKIRGKIEAAGGVKNFTFTKQEDGKLYFRKGEFMTEVKRKPDEIAQIEKLCEIRDVARKLLDKQSTCANDEDLIPLRKDLNHLYDNYRSKYDAISLKSSSRLFDEDADYPLLQGLEKVTNNGVFEKADIFSKRTVNAETEIKSAENIEEALQISLDKKGKPDVEYMSVLIGEKPDEVYQQLIENELVFKDHSPNISDKPFNDIIEKSEYLSGNVREKLIFAENAQKENPEFSRNVNALKNVIPVDIKAEDITLKMGVPLVDEDDYTNFLKELSGRKDAQWRNCKVHYNPANGEFEIENARSKKNLNLNETTKYGTSELNMYEISEKILNSRQIQVRKDVEVPDPINVGKVISKSVVDTAATRQALEKARSIKEEFKNWIFATPERKEKYERRYNDTFNCLVGREYDGSRISLPGMANNVKLRPHQMNAIARAAYGGNTLLAHVVGAGKSFEMFASIMKRKQLGLIDKACMVVPKPLTEQTASEFQKLYPSSRILSVTNDDLSSESKRLAFTARVATGSYDCVIMSAEQFEKIPMSKEFQRNFLQNQIDELNDLVKDKKRESQGHRDYSVKQLEIQMRKLKVRLDKIANPTGSSKAKDDLLEFEKLGFNYLAVDESHLYKNGFVNTKMTNVAGVTTTPSGRAGDMQMKCDWFNENMGQGHILFATGTPVSNSMTELYVMTRYLRPDLLESSGVRHFDDWAATFGNVTTQLEQTAYDTFKLKTRFSQFANLPELMAQYKEFADIKSAESLQLPRPNLKDGKPTVINVEPSLEQIEFVRQLSKRAEKIANGTVKPTDDNMLKITGEARQIGLGNQAVASLWLKSKTGINPDMLTRKDGKIDECAKQVADIYRMTTKENPEKGTTDKGVQIIFSDINVNAEKENDFSAYQYLKKELIERHKIPENEIIFAPKSDSKNRADIFAKINSGEVRVVIASTGTLGTGANVQKKLAAIHHLDIPWKPSDFEQREGRILRQGNENKEVQIFNYVTKGTLDSYLYATVTNKARFIAQLLDNEAPARVCEDMDEKVLTFAEIQAVCAGRTEIKERIECANQLAELTAIKRDYNAETYKCKQKIQDLPKRISEAKETIENAKKDCQNALNALPKSSDPNQKSILVIENNGIKYTEKAAEELLLAVAKNALSKTEPVEIGTVGNFKLTAKSEERAKSGSGFLDTEPYVIFTLTGNLTYSTEAGLTDNSRNIQRICNVLNDLIPNKKENLETRLQNLETDLKQASDRASTPFSREDEIPKLERKIEELDKVLSEVTTQTDVVSDGEEITETLGEKADREKVFSETDPNDFQPVPDEPQHPPSKPKK